MKKDVPKLPKSSMLQPPPSASSKKVARNLPKLCLRKARWPKKNYRVVAHG
jgi:hypothetical protein